MRRLAAWLGLLTLLVAVGALGFWAGRVAFEQPQDPLAGAEEPVTFEVFSQTLGRSLRFAAVAEWSREPLGRAGRGGVVTSVDVDDGAAMATGDVVYSVDLLPVVVAEGSVPAFRTMSQGVEGADVAQLQAMLGLLGFTDVEPDGVFGGGTAPAVRKWEESLGVDDDGVVALGDVVFVPGLPMRMAATDQLVVGGSLAGGELVLSRVSAAPRVVVPLSVEQRNLVPLTGNVLVTYPGGVWDAVIVEAVESSDQGLLSLELVLGAPGGGPVCGEACAEWVSFQGRTDFPVEIVVVPETTGPVVPTAAITTDPGGGLSVTLASGESVPVTVAASTDALAIVDGVEVGDVVLLPFGEPPAAGG